MIQTYYLNEHLDLKEKEKKFILKCFKYIITQEQLQCKKTKNNETKNNAKCGFGARVLVHAICQTEKNSC